MSTHLVITCDNCSTTTIVNAWLNPDSITVAIQEKHWQHITYTSRRERQSEYGNGTYIDTGETTELRCPDCALTPLEQPSCHTS